MDQSDWRVNLSAALKEMLDSIEGIKDEHIHETPQRVVRMFLECLASPPSLEEMKETLRRGFEHTRISQMIYITSIDFITWCSHHLVPVISVAHFAYIPDGKIIGLSKIARLIEMAAKKPQVQELLTEEVVDIFQDELQPKGSGLIIDSKHMCMVARGIRKQNSWTRTSALRGEFMNSEKVLNEFLHTVPPIPTR